MIDGAGLIGVEMGPTGVAVSDNRRGVRLFKITSGSNPYAASEVWLNESSGATAVTGVYDLTAAQNQLWEVNGNTSVAANTIVEAVPNPAGNGFWFSAPSTGGPSYLEEFLSSNTTLTGASGAGQLMVSLVLPAGKWLVSYNATAAITTTANGDYIAAWIAVVSGTATLGVTNGAAVIARHSNTTFGHIGTAGGFTSVDTAAGATVGLYCLRSFAGTVSVSVVYGGAGLTSSFSTYMCATAVSF